MIMIIIYEILTSNKLSRKNIFWFAFFGLMVFNATFNNISFLIKVVSDLRQVGDFLLLLRFLPPIKLIATISYNYCT
jgi:hypothetical protein